MSHAKAQRREERRRLLRVPFASLRLCVRLCCLGSVIVASALDAQTPAKDGALSAAYAPARDESRQYAVETLSSGLDNPCGVAVRPGAPPAGPWEIFIAESGAGQVVRASSTADSAKPAPVIVGFPRASYGSGPSYRIGPLSLDFLTPTKLVVGTGGLDDGKEIVQVYLLPDSNEPIAYDKADHAVGPVIAGPKSATGEGNFFGLAKTEDALFVASHGDDAYGWILKASLAANRLADLQPFIATRKLTGGGAPSGLAINPKPNAHYLVVSQMGTTGEARDSVLSFFSPRSENKLALMLPLGLRDAVAIAYSPSGDLYALDFSWAAPAEGGVYRIDAAPVDGREGCRPVKIAAVTRPTGLAFAPDGSLYVTAIGDRTDLDQPPTGVLLKITPAGDTPKL